jgi:hypothetical protein
MVTVALLVENLSESQALGPLKEWCWYRKNRLRN